jgi:hypothetical protein
LFNIYRFMSRVANMIAWLKYYVEGYFRFIRLGFDLIDVHVYLLLVMLFFRVWGISFPYSC